jgi:hypothetical protein
MLFVWPFKIIENIFNLKDGRGEISLVKSDEEKIKLIGLIELFDNIHNGSCTNLK